MIRRFLTADLKEVMDIWLTSNIQAHPDIDATYWTNQYETFMVGQLLESKTYVYEIEGKVVGFASLNMQMMLNAINVHPDYQRAGIGEALLDELSTHTQKMFARVFINNVPAINFLNTNGFVAIENFIDQQANQAGMILERILIEDRLTN